jgi:hypothetical protein
MPSPSFPKMGNPFRKISRRPSGPAGFKEGGMPMVMKDGKKIPAFAADGEGKMKRGGSVKKMAGGGLAAGHKQADGIARKGKTDTKRVVMKSGGAVKKMRSGGKTC